MKSIIFFDTALIGSRPSGPQSQLGIFLKYFLKYLKHLSFYSNYGTAKSKVKSMKLLHNLSLNPSKHPSEWRIILTNKTKLLQNLSNTGQPPTQFIEKIKHLSGLTSLLISFFTKRLPDQPEYLKRIMACGMIKRLTKMQSLKIGLLTKDDEQFIHQLDASSRPLNHLNTLRIYCKWKEVDETEPLEMLKNQKTILKYVTCLKLDALCSLAHQKARIFSPFPLNFHAKIFFIL